mmetsp:Transcript_70773/g.179141  ORF Transcript_70773/g.179141 Transcript_70773/m.179141 type:complete len:264 (+) Transcript_70773:354-1145(+)
MLGPGAAACCPALPAAAKRPLPTPTKPSHNCCAESATCTALVMSSTVCALQKSLFLHPGQRVSVVTRARIQAAQTETLQTGHEMSQAETAWLQRWQLWLTCNCAWLCNLRRAEAASSIKTGFSACCLTTAFSTPVSATASRACGRGSAALPAASAAAPVGRRAGEESSREAAEKARDNSVRTAPARAVRAPWTSEARLASTPATSVALLEKSPQTSEAASAVARYSLRAASARRLVQVGQRGFWANFSFTQARHMQVPQHGQT